MMCKISFIVPIYNTGNYIKKCVESITNQTFDDIEIILIDDGSTDNSYEVCNSLGKKDSRIILLHQENQGVSVARNLGLSMAKGEWICFVDGDDWVEIDLCKSVEPYLLSKYDIICFSYNEVTAKKIKSHIVEGKDFKDFDKSDFLQMQKAIFKMQGFKYTNAASIWAKMYRKEFIENNNLRFKENQVKSQDTLFALYAYQYAQRGIYINTSLYNYRIISSSISRRYNCNIIKIYTDLLKEFYAFLNCFEIYEEFKTFYEYRVLRNFLVAVTLDFCHYDNPKPYSTRRKEFLEASEKMPFVQSINRVKLKEFPVKERILAFLVTRRYFFLTNSCNKARYVLRKMGK